eukprot:962481-Amphidinium_carterae.1
MTSRFVCGRFCAKQSASSTWVTVTPWHNYGGVVVIVVVIIVVVVVVVGMVALQQFKVTRKRKPVQQYECVGEPCYLARVAKQWLPCTDPCEFDKSIIY